MKHRLMTEGCSRTYRRVGFLLGAISSTFSSIFILRGARHAGRDPALDLMEVAMVPMRSRGITRRPTPSRVVAGLLSHQAADILWAFVFGRWFLPRMRARRRRDVLLAALPWAVGTAAAEYVVFLPRVQPWLRMQVPFWTAAGVHVSSAAVYPLVPWIADRLGAPSGEDEEGDRALAVATASGAAVTLAGLAVLGAFSRRGRDPRWPGVRREGAEARFLYGMHGHHEVGLRLSRLAADRAQADPLPVLGRLMEAQHREEIELIRDWWRGWFGGEVPPLAAQDRASMSGMPTGGELSVLEGLSGPAFDRRFVELMVPHHEGAVRMSDRAFEEARDPRVRLFADEIRHTQRGQIEEMRRAVGSA